MEKFYRYGSLCLKGLLILALSTALVTRFMPPRILMERLPYNYFVIKTPSMAPALEVGDLVGVKKAQPPFKVGDILVVEPQPGLYVSHYYAAEVQDPTGEVRYKTHAFGQDERRQWDPWALRPDQVLGQVSGRLPKIGRLILFLQTPCGWLALGFGLALWLLYEGLTMGEEKSEV